MGSLSLEIKNHIGYVTLNHPPVNAYTQELYVETTELFTKINDMKDIFVVIFRAEGRIFCAGNDVNAFKEVGTPEESWQKIQNVAGCMSAVYQCKKPTIAAVQGHAVGAGLALAACCDMVIAAEDVNFGIPEIKVGIIGASGFAKLIAPPAIAKYMAMTGKNISAKELKAYGGILDAVPKEQLLERAEKLAEELIGTGPVAVSYFKQAFNDNMALDLAGEYYHEYEYSKKYRGTPDANEAVLAFLEKRKPNFKGES